MAPKPKQSPPTSDENKPPKGKRQDNHRYSQNCLVCLQLVRRKYMDRHMKLHPEGLKGGFIPCMVSVEHLRRAPQHKVQNETTQTRITYAESLGCQGSSTSYGNDYGPPKPEVNEMAQRIIQMAKDNCAMCKANQVYFEQNFDQLIGLMQPVLNNGECHSEGCRAPVVVLLKTYLPGLLEELGIIYDVGQMIEYTYNLGVVLDLEYLLYNGLD